MQCAELSGGVLLLRSDIQPAQCSGTPFVLVADGQDLAAFEINSAGVLQAFSFGFGAVVFFWFLGYSVGAAKQLISKL